MREEMPAEKRGGALKSFYTDFEILNWVDDLISDLLNLPTRFRIFLFEVALYGIFPINNCLWFDYIVINYFSLNGK